MENNENNGLNFLLGKGYNPDDVAIHEIASYLVEYAKEVTDREELIKFANWMFLNHVERRKRPTEQEVDEYLQEQPKG